MTFDALYSLLEGYCSRIDGLPDGTSAELRITGEAPGVMNITSADGKPVLSRGEMPGSEFGVTVDSSDLERLLRGEMKPMSAYMSGKIKLRGSIAKLMKLAGKLI